jgi:twitching motility protein PilT
MYSLTASQPVDHLVRQPLQSWLLNAVDRGASDLHIVAGHAPTIRVHGLLQSLDSPDLASRPLSDDDAQGVLLPLLPAAAADRFAADKNADFAFQIDRANGPQRFRANYFRSGQGLGACFRIIPAAIPDFEWAGFPFELADRLAHFRNGLVLVAGITGSGKTTTLAMIVNLLCQEGGYRIITVEEPIEYVFPRSASSVVTQREVGDDVHSFADGLKYGLRQDPDVILVGEIRDRETGQMALSAAETGHLVFATMHTRDAKGAISRYTDLFPQSVQNEIRAQLATGLRAVVSQHLLPSAQRGSKRELALEIMFTNPAIASAIRFSKLETIDNYIVTGRADGMLTLDESVKRLLNAGKITRETAEYFVSDKAFLRR